MLIHRSEGEAGRYTQSDIAGLNVILVEKLAEKGVEANTAAKIAEIIVSSKAGKSVSAEQADLLAAFEKDSNIMSVVNEVFTDKKKSEQQTNAVGSTNAISKPLDQYPAEKQSLIKSYLNAVDTNIKNFVARVKSGDLSFKRQKISDVSERAAADIGNILGIDVSGYTNNINTNGVQHILNRHGENGEHDSTMSRDDDIARVGWVLDNYDSVELLTEKGQPVLSSEFRDKNDEPAYQVKFTKRIDGSYYVVEAACENAYKKLWVQSTYLQKNEDVTQAPAEGKTANHETNAQSALASPSSDTTIQQPVAGVNGEVVADEVESAEGKVLRGNTAVQISGFSEAESGKLQVKLTDGSTADVSELSFPDAGEAELWRVLTEYSGDAASAQRLLEAYHNSELDANRFARAVEEGFLFGSVNMSPKEMNRRGNYVYMLAPNLRQKVYQMGQDYGEQKAQQRDQEARAGRRTDNPSVASGDSSLYTREPSKDTEGIATSPAAPRNDKESRIGAVHYGYDGQKVDKSKLSPTQKVGVHFAEKLARKKGMTFYFFESFEQDGVRVFKNAQGETVELKENGWYDPSDGSIHIDLNCGDMGSTVLYTIAHELTHFIKDMSAVKYRTLCSIVTEGFLDHGQSVQELVKNKQDDYAAMGQDLTWEEAYDEVIASAMEGIIDDGQVMDLLDEIETRDMNLGEQVMNFLRDVADLLWETVHAYRDVRPESPEGKMVTRMKGIHAQLQQAFAEALHDAGENFREGAKMNTANQGGVKYSITEPFTDNSGTSFDSAVLLDTNFFDGLSPYNWGNHLRNFVYERALNNPFILPVVDEVGQVQQLQFARASDRVSKNGKSTHKVLDELSTSNDNISKLAVVHIDEIIEISERDNPYYTTDHKHGWLDQNGWLHRTANVINARNGNVYQLTIDIGKARDGRHILYATKGKIKKVGNVQVNSLKIRGSGLNSNSTQTVPQNGIKVNKKSATNSPKSLRYQKNQAAQAHVAQQNSSLEEDVQALNQLTAEQRKRGNAGRLERGSLDAAASFLMKTAGAKGDKGHLMQILDRFYAYVATTENTHWEDVREQALPVVRWLMDNTVRTQQRSEYAQDVKKLEIRGEGN